MTESKKDLRPLIRRLRNLELLREEDEQLLRRVFSAGVRGDAGDIVVNEGEHHRHTRVLLQGWAIRYRTLAGGERQIINILLPGDTIGLYAMLFPDVEASVELITDAQLAKAPATGLLELFDSSARLGAALCWIAAQDERMLEQNIVRIGQLEARKRVAHLLLELLFRQILAGATPDAASIIPLTQSLIAEALALSLVHTNRCVRAIEKEGWIATNPGEIVIREPEQLMGFCGFDSGAVSAGVVNEILRKRLNCPDRNGAAE